MKTKKVGLAALGALGWLGSIPAVAQDRSADNAVTQADDAFGYSVGRETIGIYSGNNTRGFSPGQAGNIRIEGLYFDDLYDPISPLIGSVSIKVGLASQGYLFSAPSGIIDIALRRPTTRPGASIVFNTDSFGTAGFEVDGSLPLTKALQVGYGLTGGITHYPDGTSNSITCGSACKKDPLGGVIGVQKGPLISMV